MSADSPRRSSGGATRGMVAVPAIVPPQVVSDRSILDSAIGFINEVTLAHQPLTDPKDTITWARFETAADISDPRFGEDWELEGNVAPPLLLILGYGLGVQVWAIPANGEAVEVLSWRHGIVSALRVLPTPSSTVAVEENGRADEPIDAFAEKRPLIALVDGSSSSGSQPQFCAVNFISLKTGTQVKTIKFKNPVIDILANRSSIVITFHERIAVFDARTLDDRLSITTCYPSPGINPNPVALGPRWLAYAEHKLLHSKRSGGGCDGDGVASYTATVLNASKSLVKGLRELGEQVAAGLTGTSGSAGSSKNTSFDSGMGPDAKQSGIVTIIDVKNPLRDYSPTSGVPMSSNQTAGTDPIIAHFIAHPEALVAMEFDNSGMLLVTADRRGHDFHVFRIQPNPVGPSLAAVHHLYVLHRGDTSAKVQNISLSLDSRWVAVSTLRGTTHVFPITPYGGPMGVRTHTSLHVVNKLSRFHRSAGLSAEGRSNSPISHSESTTFSQSLQPYHNPTLPPFHRPTVVLPLAQLRQPFALGSPPGSATLAGVKSVTGGGSGSGSQRQRLSSLSDDSGKPLSVCAIFAKSRSWLLDPPNVTREAPHRMQRKAVDSLFVMAGHGALIQYDLDTKLAPNVAKEKICDDTPIELEVEAKAQWNLGRRKEGSQEIMPPLTLDNWLVKNRNSCMLTDSTRQYDDSDDRGESWLAQVEIVTHAGPHRRLWMGPQFVFKTYNTPSGSNLSHVDIEAVEIGTTKSSTTTTTTTTTKPEHSSPLNMPLTAAHRSSAVPVLIESGSYSSIEQSPKLMDRFRHDHLDSDYSVAHGDTRLKEDLADAMRESPSTAAAKESGRVCETGNVGGGSGDNVAFYDALTDHDDQDDPDYVHARTASAAALASALPNIHSYDNSSSYESLESIKKPKASIEKIVNPLGTVTTVTSCLTADVKTDILDEVVSQLAAEDTIIHENCDESLFRPVVTIFCDEKTRLKNEEEALKNQEHCQPPETISNKLVVPVIAKEVDDELNKKEKEKNSATKAKVLLAGKELENLAKEKSKFEELSSLNKKSKGAIAKGEKQNENTLKTVKDITKTGETMVKEKPTICQESKTTNVKECDKKTTQAEKTYQEDLNKNEKESLKYTECKTRKITLEKRVSPEKESTQSCSKKEEPKNKKSEKIDEDDEKPMEFIRMTPKVAEKITPSKNLSKKELKKQQQQNAKEEPVELTSDVEKVKKIEVKREAEPTAANEIKLGEEKIKKNDKISEEKSQVVKSTTSECIKQDTKKDIPKEDITTKTLPSKSTHVIKSEQIKNKSEDKDKEQASLVNKSKTETTALLGKLNTTDKSCLKDETKTVTKKVTDVSKTKPTERKEVIKTEQLNVKDLADSLIELKDDIEEESSKTVIKKDQNVEKQQEKPIITTPPLETVDIFAAPTKVSRKNKKKGNKSGSSSENEEIIEVTATTKTKPKKSEEKAVLEKSASTSSEDSYTDLADSLLERKDNLEETMFVSFTQTEERKTTKDQEKSEQNLKITSKECDIKKDSSEKSELDVKKEVQAKTETIALKAKENIELKQEKNVIKTKEKITLEKLEAKPEKNVEDMKFEKESTTEKENKKLLESAINKKSLKEDKTELKEKTNEAKEKSNSGKSDEKTVLPKTNLKKPTKDETAISIDIKKDDDLKQSQEEQIVHQVLVETKNDEMKSINKRKSVETEKTNVKDKDKKEQAETKVEAKKEPTLKMETKIQKDPEINMKSNGKKPDQPATKETQIKNEEPQKDDKKPIVTKIPEEKPESKKTTIKAEDSKNSNAKTDPKPLKEKQHEQQKPEDIKVKASPSHDLKVTPKECAKKESLDKKSEITAPIKETNKNKMTPHASPKNKDQEELEPTKIPTTTATPLTKQVKKSPDNLEETKKIPSVDLPKEDNKKEEHFEILTKKVAIEVDKPRVKENPKEKVSIDSVDTSEITKPDKPKQSTDKIQTPLVLPPPISAWKTLSGAEMINKNLNKPDTDSNKFPSLGAISKTTTSKISSNTEKLLPELPTPKEMQEPLCLGKITKKPKKSPALDDFSILKPLGSLPPLPALEPLELMTESRSSNIKDFSLINFESPLQENPALQRKITPPPRGFTEQNLIFALCGSLHYENEHTRSSPEKPDLSPTLSSNRSSSAMDEPSMADYKSLTENDDPYISLEQSSQDTNTTNTNTTNEKFSSSTNSSGSEEIIIMEEKKMTKKQKRKRQQQLQELQKQKELQQQQQHQEMDDEELRPLIAMTESQIDQIPSGNDTNLPTLMDASFTMKPLITTQTTLTHSTTTDSEGPMPATTSDDNVFTISAHAVAHTQHKIKTKKLEHKINLIAAIEAATSSSTSSAEESGVELEGRRSSHDNDESSLISVANSVAATTLPLPIVVSPQTTVGALKKKTKRRKR